MTSTSKKKKGALHVAVVVNALVGKTDLSMLPSGGRPSGGDWASFIGPNRDKVVADAMAANKRWGDKYVVLVGSIDFVAEAPKPVYELRPIR